MKTEKYFNHSSRTEYCWLALAAVLGATTLACGEEDEPDIATPPVSGRLNPCRGIEVPNAYVAPELCARAVAVDQGPLRQLTFAENGELFGVRTNGEIVRYHDTDQNGMFEGREEIIVVGNTGGNGNNVDFSEDEAYLYAGSPDGVVRFRYDSFEVMLPEAEPVVVNQPSSGTHTFHTVRVYDGWLYVNSGSENNAVTPDFPAVDTDRAVLKRFPLAELDTSAPWDWFEDGEVYVRGLRNMVGFARNGDGEMYGVVNGMDNLMYDGEDVHINNPGEDLVMLRAGESHGYPYCFTAQNIVVDGVRVAPGTRLATGGIVDSDFENPYDDTWCQENTAQPETFLPAHSAPLGITFYTNTTVEGLPAEWAGGAFVTQHGSWNTDPSVGHNVVFFPFEDGATDMPDPANQGTDYPYTVIFGGGSEGQHDTGSWGWSNEGVGEDPVRPVGVAISPSDGALYVSSDNAGVLGTGDTSEPRGVIYRLGLPIE